MEQNYHNRQNLVTFHDIYYVCNIIQLAVDTKDLLQIPQISWYKKYERNYQETSKAKI